ncbi:MAG TPA: DUF1543 domain-containing protein [Bdellovibrionota bacterium]|jgi:hypothetical protein|nr:DUF1543 domain-containing protein [Bdellovibrionota bacterium]
MGGVQLYLVHVGYYDAGLGQGIFESHADLIVAASSFEEARTKAKAKGLEFGQKVHIDGMLRIDAVEGLKVSLEFDANLDGSTVLTSNKERELAPKPALTL